MTSLLAALAGVVLALLYTTLLPGVTLLLVVIGLAGLVDIGVAVAFALGAGIFLDVIDVHALGISSTLVYLVAAGAVEAARVSVRAFADRPAVLVLLASGIAALLMPVLTGIPFHAAAVRAVLLRLIVHVVATALLLPVFMRLGAWHRARLREGGLL